MAQYRGNDCSHPASDGASSHRAGRVAVGFAFGRVFIGHGATYRLLAVSVASACVAWMFERRSLPLATAVSAVLLVVAIGIAVFPATTWFRGADPRGPSIRWVTLPRRSARKRASEISPAPATILSCSRPSRPSGRRSSRASRSPSGRGAPCSLSFLRWRWSPSPTACSTALIKPIYGVLFLIAALAVVFADSLRRIHGWGRLESPGARNRLLPSAGRGRAGSRRRRRARRAGTASSCLGSARRPCSTCHPSTPTPRVHVSPLGGVGRDHSTRATPSRSSRSVRPTRLLARWSDLDVLDDTGQWSPATRAGSGRSKRDSRSRPNLQGTTITERFTVTHDLAYAWLPVRLRAQRAGAGGRLGDMVRELADHDRRRAAQPGGHLHRPVRLPDATCGFDLATTPAWAQRRSIPDENEAPRRHPSRDQRTSPSSGPATINHGVRPRDVDQRHLTDPAALPATAPRPSDIHRRRCRGSPSFLAASGRAASVGNSPARWP